MSGASGGHAATAAENAALAARPELAMRGFSTLTGHMKEAQFPFAVALAALAVHHKVAYPAFDPSERPFSGQLTKVLATAIGYHQFEGMALVRAAD
jgi:3-oxoacyl-[acyl-carrier-protein] synthase II